MKFLSILLSMALTGVNGCTQSQEQDFSYKVLNDISRNCYYISLPAIVDSKSSAIVAKNDDIYSYFSDKMKVGHAQYIEEAKKIITGRKKIQITKQDIREYHFAVILLKGDGHEDKPVNKEKLLRKYFTNNVLLDTVPNETKYQIIKDLFDLKVPVKMDDETGYLVVEE